MEKQLNRIEQKLDKLLQALNDGIFSTHIVKKDDDDDVNIVKNSKEEKKINKGKKGSKNIEEITDVEKTEDKKRRDMKSDNLYTKENSKFIENCLTSHSVSADLKFLQKFYLTPGLHSVQKHSSNSVKYWLDGSWNKDILSEYSKTVMCKNMINAYLNINQFDKYENNMDIFLENQTHINKLKSLKYQANLMQQFMKLL